MRSRDRLSYLDWIVVLLGMVLMTLIMPTLDAPSSPQRVETGSVVMR